jgi:hypothetical protein
MGKGMECNVPMKDDMGTYGGTQGDNECDVVIIPIGIWWIINTCTKYLEEII